MPASPSSNMQMPTPPMTLDEYQWEHHHKCTEWQSLLSDEVLLPAGQDWTLFPDEGSPLSEPTPKPSQVRQSAKTPRPPQGRAQKDSKAKKQQHQHDNSKKVAASKRHTARSSKTQDSKTTMGRKPKAIFSDSKETDRSKSLTYRVAGFEEIPRTSAKAPTSGRFPTPPIEEMGEMFAPIEALGEDLRWCRSYHANCNGSERLSH